MLNIHIARKGDDNHPGTVEKPLATLAGARDRLRDMRRAGHLPKDGAEVILHAGTYRLTETFKLDIADSGTAGAPVVFRAAPGEEVTLTGGMELPSEALRPVTDPAILARLPEAARPHVRVAEVGPVSAAPCAAEITFNGVPLTLARWPNAGYARIAGAAGPKREDGFHYHGDQPRHWREPGEAWFHVWGNDWDTARVQVAEIDLNRRLIRGRPPFGSPYGFPRNGRFFCFNILEELDEPGDYYIDRQSGRLYVWLPDGAHTGNLWVSLLDQPLVELTGASHVRFEGIAFRHGRADGLVVRGGSDVTLAGCLVSGFGGTGIRVEGGFRHRIRGCEVSQVGGSGISLSGGDRRTLEPAGHAAENNHVHHFAQWTYCYNPGIHVGGGSYGSLMGSVGIRIANNRIHDCPHNGILYWGNDLEIEGNEIYRVLLETTDAGAIYTGRDFARRGTLIRHNHLHHNGGGGPFGTMGIYLDDCAGGERVVGNVVEGHKQAVYMGGGTDTVCENNLFLDCDPALHLDMRGLLGGCRDILRERFYEVRAHEPPYSARYPELAKIHAHYEKGEGIPPEGTVVRHNLAAGPGAFWSYTSAGVDRRCLAESDNRAGLPLEHVDRERGGLKPEWEAEARAIGFTRIPVKRIGPVVNADRPLVPPRALLDYRLVIDTPWSWRDNATTDPIVRLEVANLGGQRERGVAELFVSPAEEAEVGGDARLEFDLAPGESLQSGPLRLAPAGHVAQLEAGVRRVGAPDLPAWHWLYLKHTVTAPRLGRLTEAARVFDALAATPPLRTAAWDGACGEVRLGLAEGSLAVAFDLVESDLGPRLDDAWWQEACIELFGFGPANPVTEQVGLVPAGPVTPAAALWFHDAVRQPEAPGAEVVSERTPRGYRLAALVPDRLLGWDRARAVPTLEISLNVKPRTDAPRERIRVFGVQIWQNERHRFGALVPMDTHGRR